ncbi:tetraacyldisaccharide 4'-kinase [Thermodesulfobacteriota bacterium]
MELFLYAISLVYGGAVKLRGNCYHRGIYRLRQLPCVVLSIGNITVGGTGKTPTAMYVARLLQRLKLKPAVISRGYRGSAEKDLGIVSTGKKVLMTPETAGDEPFMMATNLSGIPVVVGQNRYDAGALAIREFDPDVLVLDDAFQHQKLHRDIDIVLLDYLKPFGNHHLLPRGPLREPISSMLRGDAFIRTRFSRRHGENGMEYQKTFERFSQGKPVFKSSHVPRIFKETHGKLSPYRFDFSNMRDAYAFSGIARNSDFRDTLTDLGCHLKGFSEFPDHHAYQKKDLEKILISAQKTTAECIITTEKDFTRIPKHMEWPTDLFVIGIEVDFGDDTDRFHHFIEKEVQTALDQKQRQGGI